MTKTCDLRMCNQKTLKSNNSDLKCSHRGVAEYPFIHWFITICIAYYREQ